MVVREPSGRLRHASESERDRVLDVYFPIKGRALHQPKMFHEEQLEVDFYSLDINLTRVHTN